jgi:hypothetical protein
MRSLTPSREVNEAGGNTGRPLGPEVTSSDLSFNSVRQWPFPPVLFLVVVWAWWVPRAMERTLSVKERRKQLEASASVQHVAANSTRRSHAVSVSGLHTVVNKVADMATGHGTCAAAFLVEPNGATLVVQNSPLTHDRFHIFFHRVLLFFNLSFPFSASRAMTKTLARMVKLCSRCGRSIHFHLSWAPWWTRAAKPCLFCRDPMRIRCLARHCVKQ